MQNNLQTKLQQKRWRTFAILIVLAICAGVVLAGMKFEPADYRDSLQKAITEAEQLQTDCSQNQGNSKGQYAPYTLLEYQQQIDIAKKVLDSSDSHSHRQTAFETLQQQTKAMKEAANSQVIPKEDLEQLQQSGETGKYTSQWDGGEVEISVSGESISSPSDINIAIGRGPYGDILQASCDAAQLNGMLFSLYHNGDFGAVVTFRFPLPESNRTGALYHYDKQNKKLVLVENSVNMEENVADGKTEGFQNEIGPIRRELLTLRGYYDELMDMGKDLEENENGFFARKQLKYFGTIADRADRLMGRTAYLLEYAQQVRDAYQTQADAVQNKNMQFLTVVSTIFFPLTLITGWYGMNFQNMPELRQGYPGVILLSLVVVAGCILFFKKKHML